MPSKSDQCTTFPPRLWFLQIGANSVPRCSVVLRGATLHRQAVCHRHAEIARCLPPVKRASGRRLMHAPEVILVLDNLAWAVACGFFVSALIHNTLVHVSRCLLLRPAIFLSHLPLLASFSLPAVSASSDAPVGAILSCNPLRATRRITIVFIVRIIAAERPIIRKPLHPNSSPKSNLQQRTNLEPGFAFPQPTGTIQIEPVDNDAEHLLPRNFCITFCAQVDRCDSLHTHSKHPQHDHGKYRSVLRCPQHPP